MARAMGAAVASNSPVVSGIVRVDVSATAARGCSAGRGSASSVRGKITFDVAVYVRCAEARTAIYIQRKRPSRNPPPVKH